MLWLVADDNDPPCRIKNGNGGAGIDCKENLAVAGCSFWAIFCHPVTLFCASFWSNNKCKSSGQLCVIWRLFPSPAYFCNKNSSKTGSTSTYFPKTKMI